MKISVIVSDAESKGGLMPCVLSLCAQDFPAGDYEILLPDLGRFDVGAAHLLNEIERSSPQLRILRGAVGLDRRSRRIHEAATQARGEWLLFIESHCVPPSGWLSGYARLFEREPVEIVHGGLRFVPTSSPDGQAGEGRMMTAMQPMGAPGAVAAHFDLHNAAVRKDLYFGAGGFHPDLPLLAEAEFAARLVAGGRSIRRFGESVVDHLDEPDLDRHAEVTERQGRDRARIHFMHGPDFVRTYFPSTLLRTCLALLKAFRWPLLAAQTLRLRLSRAAFRLFRSLGLRRVARPFFSQVVAAAQFQGLLKGVGDAARVAAVREAATAGPVPFSGAGAPDRA